MAAENIDFEMFQEEEINPREFRLFSSVKYGQLDYQYNQYLHWGTTILTDPQLCEIYEQVLQQFPITSQQPQQYMEDFIDQFILKNHGKSFDLVGIDPPNHSKEMNAKLIHNFGLLLPYLETIRAKVIHFNDHLQKYFPVIDPHELLGYTSRILNIDAERELNSTDLAHLGVVLVISQLADLFYDNSIQSNYVQTIPEQFQNNQDMEVVFKETINICVDQISLRNGANLLTLQFLLLVRTYSEYGYYKLTDNQVVEILITGLTKKMGLHHLYKNQCIQKLLKYINSPEIYLPWIVNQDYKLIPKEPSIPASNMAQLDPPKDHSPVDSSLIPLDLNNKLSAILDAIQKLVLTSISPLKVWKLVGVMLEQLKVTYLWHCQCDLSLWSQYALEKVLLVYTTLIDHNNNLITYYGNSSNSKELGEMVIKFNLNLIFDKLLPLLQKSAAPSSTLVTNAYAKLINSVLLFNYLMIRLWKLDPKRCLIFEVNDKLIRGLELNQQYFSCYSFFQIHSEFHRRIRQKATAYEKEPENGQVNQKCHRMLTFGCKKPLDDALWQFFAE